MCEEGKTLCMLPDRKAESPLPDGSAVHKEEERTGLQLWQKGQVFST